MTALMLALLVGVLFACGAYMIMLRGQIKLVLGLGLITHAVNLALFGTGRLTRGAPPIVPHDTAVVGAAVGRFADPLPQALILTAIVISFGVTAFIVVLIYRRDALTGSDLAPGELATVMYEFQNVQDRAMAAQAVPSYAPRQAAPHFVKMECFCFNQYELAPGEKKEWPVAFVIDPRIPKDVTTITLSYTFFEVGGRIPAAPVAANASAAGAGGAS